MSAFTRRTFLGSAAAVAFAQKKGAAPDRPNIVLILADDLAAWMVGCYGNKEIRTPNIDLLARGGARFLNNFVCTPICSPSRATLFTGRTPRQHGIHDFLTAQPVADPPQGQKDMPASFKNEVMISDILAAAGYNCGYVGKWHMGEDQHPPNHFDFTYTMAGGSRSYTDPEMFLDGKPVSEKGYLAELMTKQACAYIDRQNASKPFFLSIGYLNPHTPYDGHPQKYYDMYAKTNFETFGYEKPAPNALREKDLMKDLVGNIRKCAAATTALDDQLPVITRKLTEKGVLDNTILIFAGDNGFLLGRHGLFSKGLASNPPNMHEESICVPMIWNWPGRIPVQSVRPELVSFYDVLPTICEITGTNVPDRNLCGRSYAPILFNHPLPKKNPWRSTVFGQLRNTEMARDARFKLVLRNNGDGPNELFDVRADPREKVNLYESPRHVTVRDRLAAELDAWRKKYA